MSAERVRLYVEIPVEVTVDVSPPEPDIGLNGWRYEVEEVHLADGTTAPKCIADLVSAEVAISAIQDNADDREGEP